MRFAVDDAKIMFDDAQAELNRLQGLAEACAADPSQEMCQGDVPLEDRLNAAQEEFHAQEEMFSTVKGTFETINDDLRRQEEEARNQ